VQAGALPGRKLFTRIHNHTFPLTHSVTSNRLAG